MGVGSAAACCVVGGVSLTSSRAESAPVRPPGGQDQTRFLAACLRCDRCRSVCPQGCIGIATLEDGFLAARTPKMDFRRGACDFCNRCVDVCPTGALSVIDPECGKLGVAVVSPERCVAWKNPGSCIRCEEACEYGAVSIRDGVPVVDARRCNGCGACEYWCPALVFTSTRGGVGRGIAVTTIAAYEVEKQEADDKEVAS